MIAAGRVAVNGRIERNPEHPMPSTGTAGITVDGVAVQPAVKHYLALNKPRGLVVSADDERGRATVYTLFNDPALPWLGPVGRLDKASEGLLLMTNDTLWAAGITEPSSSLPKTYHVQIAGQPTTGLVAQLTAGVDDRGQRLAAQQARLLRAGERNAWLEIVLDEGRNRHIRRLLDAQGYEVLRLVRIAIGPVALGNLPKGGWRHLTAPEIAALRRD